MLGIRVLCGLAVVLFARQPAVGQTPGTHEVYIDRSVATWLEALPKDTVTAYCATAWHVNEIERAVYVDAIREAGVAVNPTCATGEAPVLVRPHCVFNVPEFVGLRVRASYVLLLCRPNGVGIRLAPPRTVEQARIT